MRQALPHQLGHELPQVSQGTEGKETAVVPVWRRIQAIEDRSHPKMSTLPSNLASMNKDELKKLCSARKVKIKSTDTKASMIVQIHLHESMKKRMRIFTRPPSSPQEDAMKTPGKRRRNEDENDEMTEIQPSPKLSRSTMKLKYSQISKIKLATGSSVGDAGIPPPGRPAGDLFQAEVQGRELAGSPKASLADTVKTDVKMPSNLIEVQFSNSPPKAILAERTSEPGTLEGPDIQNSMHITPIFAKTGHTRDGALEAEIKSRKGEIQ